MPKNPWDIPKIPGLPKVRADGTISYGGYTGPDRRKNKRISLEELNERGPSALADIPNLDDRGALTKVLDIIDVPRNVVGQGLAKLVGMKTGKLPKATFGLPRVTGSDLLRHVGVRNKAVLAVGGFAADVLADPLLYATLGSSTGLSLGKAAPKILKSGQRVIRRGVEAAMRGLKVSPEMTRTAKALGMTESRLGQWARAAKNRFGSVKVAMKQMAGKRAGRAFDRLYANVSKPSRAKAAAEFLVKHGEPGRTILRAPFMEKGLSLSFGRKAKLFKEFVETAKTGKLGAMTAKAASLGKFRKVLAGASVAKASGEVALAAEKQRALWQIAEEKAKIVESLGGTRLIYKDGVPVRATERQFANAVKAASGGKFGTKAAEKRTLGEMLKGDFPTWGARWKAIVAERKKLGQSFKEADVGAKAMSAEIKAYATSPKAPLSLQLKAAEELGPAYLKELPAGATKWQAAKWRAGRLKQAVFGAGNSFFSRRVAALKFMGGQGAATVRDRVHTTFEKTLKPLIANVSAQTGRPIDEVAARMVDLIETNGGKALDAFHAADPIRSRVTESLHLFVNRSDVMDAVADYGRLVQGFKNKAVRAGVDPGWVDNFFHRGATEEFGKMLKGRDWAKGKLPYTSPRVRFAEYETPKGLVKELTSNTEEIGRLEKAVAKGKAAKVGEWDMSTELWNQLASQTAPAEFMRANGRFLGQAQVTPGVAMPRFSTDIAASAGQVRGDVERRIASGQMADIAAQAGVRASREQRVYEEAFTHLVSFDDYATRTNLTATPFYQHAGHKLKGLSFPQPIIDQIDSFARLSAQPEEMRSILAYTDKFLNFWKGITLMHPAYAIRNGVTDYFRAAANGVSIPRVLGNTPEALSLTRSLSRGRSIKGMVLHIGEGRPIPAISFVREARLYNMTAGGFTSQVMEPGGFNRVKSLWSKVNRSWFELNNEFETTRRLSIVMTLMEDGMTMRQAAMKVIQIMPDLTDLSNFEKTVGRRIFPWYSWLRKNGASVFKEFLDKPILLGGTEKFRKYVELALQGDDVVDPALRPDWMAEQQAMQVAGDKDRGTVFLLASWLPYQDLLDLFSAAPDWSHFANGILTRLRPEAKFLIETGGGVDLFKHRPVEPFSSMELLGAVPAAVVGKSATPLDAMLGLRPFREAVRTAEMPSRAEKISRLFIGGALQPLVTEKARAQKAAQLRDKAKKIRQAINRARAVKHESEERRLSMDWFRVNRELMELGGEGVPKAAQAKLQSVGVKAGAK